MRLHINGQFRTFADPLNVVELLNLLQLTQGRVVVELNRSILTAEAHAATVLKDGDTLELIQFVGGG